VDAYYSGFIVAVVVSSTMRLLKEKIKGEKCKSLSRMTNSFEQHRRSTTLTSRISNYIHAKLSRYHGAD
jgi:hypothetical protein